MISFKIEERGRWSGGGMAFLSNARHASIDYEILRGYTKRVIPIIPRNVPFHGIARGDYVLVPQNAWPWTTEARGVHEVARLGGMRVASEIYARRATAVMRISSAIPRFRSQASVSPVIHNVLDPEFEHALDRSSTSVGPDCADSFVTIGSVHSYRNLINLIEGYKQYRAVGGTQRLFIAGPATNGKAAKRVTALSAGIPGVTTSWGSLSREAAILAMRSARGVILPSLVEASPLSALEAVALNPNVAFSDILGHREILANVGTTSESAFFDPRVPFAIARAFLDLEEGHARAWHEELSSASRRARARDDWAASFARWLERLAESIESHPERGRN